MPEFNLDGISIKGCSTIYAPKGQAGEYAPLDTTLPLCACGCGEPVALTREGRPNTYIHGHARRGISPSPEHRRKLSLAQRGKPGPWKDKKMPTDARARMSAAKKGKTLLPEHRAKIGWSMSAHYQITPDEVRLRRGSKGAANGNWKGGVAKKHERHRRVLIYREWRLAVFRRDHFTCQACGAKSEKGSKPTLHAHHIKPYSKFPELRFSVENGQTLCRECHIKTHSKGD